MGKSTGSKKVGVTGNYEYQSEVNPEQEIHSIKCGIYKKYKDLTDADIEKMIAAGNKAFTKAAKAAVVKEK